MVALEREQQEQDSTFVREWLTSKLYSEDIDEFKKDLSERIKNRLQEEKKTQKIKRKLERSVSFEDQIKFNDETV